MINHIPKKCISINTFNNLITYRIEIEHLVDIVDHMGYYDL